MESLLEKNRRSFIPEIPKILKNLPLAHFEKKPSKSASSVKTHFPKSFSFPLLALKTKKTKNSSNPLRVGVVFSGGQASGGHNVICGLFDALTHPKSTLIGFLGGPSAIVQNKHKLLTKKLLAAYRNQGGFDLIGSGRTKIETEEQMGSALKTVQALKLDGLVIIGGDDSNTNAALLAEFFLQNGCSTRVMGIPKTIDGDLKNENIEISFGFDTACKVYSELIGNIARDCLSAKKYYHFIKLMGRSASHIALECALKTHPNLTLISEEVLAKKQTLQDLVQEVANLVEKRSNLGKEYGVILIPEGVIEFIPEFKVLITELNTLLANKSSKNILSSLSSASLTCYTNLPSSIQQQLISDRDPHGNVHVSGIETEKLLMEMVKKELSSRKTYKGKFSSVGHFFGYEGRAAYPSNFDATYCYNLGRAAALLIAQNHTGYMVAIGNLIKPVSLWRVEAIPLTQMIHLELRHGQKKPVIKKALVELKEKPFLYFSKQRNTWSLEDLYQFPGPMQFFAEKLLTNQVPQTLQLEQN